MTLSTIPTRALTEQGINFRNLIINGDMSIAQRGTSVTGVTSGTYKTVDRFRLMISSAGTWTVSQSDTVPTGQGFNKSFKLDCTTADASLGAGDILGITQKIEGFVQAPVKKETANAEQTTLSFWVRSNKTGTYICELVDDQNTRQVSKSYTINSADTWEKKIITFPADTVGANDFDNTQAMQVNWWLAMGSNYTSGTLSETLSSGTNANRAVGQVNLADNTANEWYITVVQLEVGTSASDFEFLPYDVNLMRCQRYYEKSYSYATALGTNTYVGATRFNGSTDASSNMVVCIEYATQKRTSPTQTYYTPSGTSGSWNIVRSGSSGTATANNWNNNETKLNAYFTFGAAHNFAK